MKDKKKHTCKFSMKPSVYKGLENIQMRSERKLEQFKC